jgi:hypothetical protein
VSFLTQRYTIEFFKKYKLIISLQTEIDYNCNGISGFDQSQKLPWQGISCGGRGERRRVEERRGEQRRGEERRGEERRGEERR